MLRETGKNSFHHWKTLYGNDPMPENSFLDVFKFIHDEHNLQLHDIPKNEADLR